MQRMIFMWLRRPGNKRNADAYSQPIVEAAMSVTAFCRREMVIHRRQLVSMNFTFGNLVVVIL